MKKTYSLIATLVVFLSLVAPAIADTPAFQVDTGGTLTTSLLAYYKLEDVNDTWTGGYNLTNNGSTAFSAAKVNNGADFGASNTTKYLQVNSSLGYSSGAWAVAGWFNITTAPGTDEDNLIFDLKENSADKVQNYLTYNNTGGTKSLQCVRNRGASGVQKVTYTFSPTIGTWYHFVCQWNGTNIQLFINTTQQGGDVASGAGGTAGGGPYFDISSQGGAVPFSGLADEFGVWNKALNSTEIADLYNSGNGQTMTTTAPATPIYRMIRAVGRTILGI